MMHNDSTRWTLRDLPFAARLAIATFLISVGVGYFSALVQLHFQHAQRGEVMPTPADAVRTFHGPVGEGPKSHVVRLLEADERETFKGTGQMSAAFTSRSSEWKSKVREKAAGGKRRAAKPTEEEMTRAEEELRKERKGELAAVLAWLRDAKADKASFEKDHYCPPEEVAKLPITAEYAGKDDEGPYVKIQTLWTHRCARCHAKDGEDANAANYPLEKHEQIAKYNKVGEGGAMSLEKLAQTTHVHLLGFSMLYGLTGLILALTNWPAFIRVPLAPLALIAQVIDISFWWLARLDAPMGPMFAGLIPLSGGVVAVSLALQIFLSLFDLFGNGGKAVLVALILLAGGGAYVVKEKVIDPHMAKEKASEVAPH